MRTASSYKTKREKVNLSLLLIVMTKLDFIKSTKMAANNGSDVIVKEDMQQLRREEYGYVKINIYVLD